MEDEQVIDDFLENPPSSEEEEENTAEPESSDQVVDNFLEGKDDEKESDDEEEKSDKGKDSEEKESDDEEEKSSLPRLNLRATADKAASLATSAHDQIAALPTPGGIGILLFVLIFFIWAVVPVDTAGKTRLQLLWLTLTGHTSLNLGANGEVSPPPGMGDGGATTAMAILPRHYAQLFDFGVDNGSSF